MKLTNIALALSALALAGQASAVTTTYTDPASFMAQVAPGAYTEGFSGNAFINMPSATFSGGAYAYTVSSPGDLYGSGGFIGTNLPNTVLTITFTGAPVTAIGGYFYAADIQDALQVLPVTVSLSDGTTTTFTPTTLANSFAGFASTAAILSLSIAGPGVSMYANLTNLTVGTAVAAIPEPSTWLMMALGAGALVLRQQRRRQPA